MKCVFLGVFSVWISIWIRRKLAVPLIYWILWVSSCCGCEWRKNHVNKFRLNCIIIIHHNLSARMPIAIVACHSTQRMSNRQRTRFEISGYFSHSLNSIRTNVEMNKLSHNILWEYSTRISYTNCWVCWHELRFKYEMNEKKKYKLIRIWRPHTQQDDEQKLQIGILIIPDDWWWKKKLCWFVAFRLHNASVAWMKQYCVPGKLSIRTTNSKTHTFETHRCITLYCHSAIQRMAFCDICDRFVTVTQSDTLMVFEVSKTYSSLSQLTARNSEERRR